MILFTLLVSWLQTQGPNSKTSPWGKKLQEKSAAKYLNMQQTYHDSIQQVFIKPLLREGQNSLYPQFKFNQWERKHTQKNLNNPVSSYSVCMDVWV